ncbi:GerAB/ArcD/ProY family transporter [Aureibacillus halotolerans]|uniref:Spore germination protein (Amino acid permease) n=1 Tax=Aureibacillus halotolerans TaxID=1508390 RepID=A0A4R6TW79_9BACI|nr:GerAB/ArcD/ProY family transporter [Aureibacillus halotolerans]TDQ36085.1 spore germination protein (amino acid permease) [Aureibacillus halotolerans]
MAYQVKKQHQVSAFFVFFLLHGVQIGISILNFQHSLVKHVQYDAWLTIAISGLLVHIIIAMIYFMMKRSNGDIVNLHDRVFGKWFGRFLLFCISIYFFVGVFLSLRVYIQIIQTWIFPDLRIWAFAIALIVLVWYIVSGGFRVVTGITVFSVVIPSFFLLILLFPLQYAQVQNLTPIFNHSASNVFQAVWELMPAFFGYFFIMFYYPFIDQAEKSQKWAHIGNVVSTLLYAFTALVSFLFFSPKQILDHLWPSISMLQVVAMPFVERFEFISLSVWLIALLPYVCLACWSGSLMLKRLTPFRQKTFVILSLACVYAALLWVQKQETLESIRQVYSQVGSCIAVGYLPFLTLLTAIRLRRRPSDES